MASKRAKLMVGSVISSREDEAESPAPNIECPTWFSEALRTRSCRDATSTHDIDSSLQLPVDESSNLPVNNSHTSQSQTSKDSSIQLDETSKSGNTPNDTHIQESLINGGSSEFTFATPHQRLRRQLFIGSDDTTSDPFPLVHEDGDNGNALATCGLVEHDEPSVIELYGFDKDSSFCSDIGIPLPVPVNEVVFDSFIGDIEGDEATTPPSRPLGTNPESRDSGIGGCNEPAVYKKRTRRNQPRENPVRKPPVKPSRSSQTKKALNKGEEHVSPKGVFRRKREVQRSCELGCRYKCHEKISEEDRLKLHARFWKLGDHSAQWVFIEACVQNFEKKTNKNKKTKRTHSRAYYLKSSNEESVRVCKTMFLSTLDITDMWVRTALTKGGSPDKRGKNCKRNIMVPPEVKESVKTHIKLFPCKDPHYLRETSTRKYLEATLTVAEMHRLYLKWIIEQGARFKPASERQYRDIFNTCFNIGTFIPKKDQCDECVSWDTLPAEVQEQRQAQHEEHIRNKERARELKNADSLQVKSQKANVKEAMACYDYQKVLQSPKGDSSLLYYKRKLNVNNFTIYDVRARVGYCYVYDETVAKKGPNEVGSFVLRYIADMVKTGIESFKFYSDNCGGQNRNRMVFSAYLYAAAKYKVDVLHRFLEKGHTQNEGDNVHSVIERRAKYRTVHAPIQWVEIIRTAKRTNPPYEVIEVDQGMIYDLKDLVQKQNWEKNIAGQKIPWSKVREVFCTGSTPGILLYKVNYDDDYSTMCSNRVGRPINLQIITLKTAYSAQLGITKAKYDDLMNLCSRHVIHSDFHDFYKSLPVVSSQDDPEDEDV